MRARFRQHTREAIADFRLQQALDYHAGKRMDAWDEAFGSLPDVDRHRQRAQDIRRTTIDNLDHYLKRFVQNLKANGFHVHTAVDAEAACRLAVDIAQKGGAKLVTKSKSMTTEEIRLNHALEQVGIRVVETDLGEFIVQLRGEAPGHLVTPAIHLRREDVAETFERELGMPYSTDVEHMNAAAKGALREVFLSADVGVSGVNLGVVENGVLCLVTNEGNGRMVTTLPPVHIAIMGIERLVPTMDDLALLLKLLPRSSTGQKISSYVTLIGGPRRESDPDGPDERHVILIDNGRLAVATSPLAESLFCIRCGACLNACPVFREIGGHAFESVYPGPIGSVVSPGLFGLEKYGHLARASTLCGVCKEVCPAGIDLPTLLLRVRDSYVQEVRQPFYVRWAMLLYAWIMVSPRRYRWGQRLGVWMSRLFPRRLGWLRWLPPPLSAWTVSRDFPLFATRPFLKRQVELPLGDKPRANPRRPSENNGSNAHLEENDDLVERFGRELEDIGGVFIRCEEGEVGQRIASRMNELRIDKLITWNEQVGLTTLVQYLHEEGFEVLEPTLPRGGGPDRYVRLAELGTADAGLTGAVAGIAETGTLVVPGGRKRSQLASLLVSVHFAILRAGDIYRTMEEWLSAVGEGQLAETACINLISGPSRTADIEMTLTIGVHGPGEVVVFCVD
ncbi:MAG: iron-sulfur cluster-binding protein [Anaerolineaceae bacterium]|nr:MAG: iron-sulfur cluster-binding protein [Anaerolineaceae bacterium]